jgi:hypothetical protein
MRFEVETYGFSDFMVDKRETYLYNKNTIEARASSVPFVLGKCRAGKGRSPKRSVMPNAESLGCRGIPCRLSPLGVVL